MSQTAFRQPPQIERTWGGSVTLGTRALDEEPSRQVCGIVRIRMPCEIASQNCNGPRFRRVGFRFVRTTMSDHLLMLPAMDSANTGEVGGESESLLIFQEAFNTAYWRAVLGLCSDLKFKSKFSNLLDVNSQNSDMRRSNVTAGEKGANVGTPNKKIYIASVCPAALSSELGLLIGLVFEKESTEGMRCVGWYGPMFFSSD